MPASQRFPPLAYRVAAAAAIVGVSHTKVWSLIREGRIPARRLDGSIIIRHEDLTVFVDGLSLVRQLAEPPATPPPVPPPAVPRLSPPPALPASVQQPKTPTHPRRVRAPTNPSVAAPPTPRQPAEPPLVTLGRSGKALPPPNPNGWGPRTLRKPSPALAAIVGPDLISRPKALAAIWKHIHAGGLQRPEDLRVIYVDDKLRAVFGTDVITSFALEALIRPHLEAIV